MGDANVCWARLGRARTAGSKPGKKISVQAPPLVAQRQAQHELAGMHALSLALLETRPVAA